MKTLLLPLALLAVNPVQAEDPQMQERVQRMLEKQTAAIQQRVEREVDALIEATIRADVRVAEKAPDERESAAATVLAAR